MHRKLCLSALVGMPCLIVIAAAPVGAATGPAPDTFLFHPKASMFPYNGRDVIRLMLTEPGQRTLLSPEAADLRGEYVKETDPDAKAELQGRLESLLRLPGHALDKGLYEVTIDGSITDTMGVNVIDVELDPKLTGSGVILILSAPVRAPGIVRIGPMKYWDVDGAEIHPKHSTSAAQVEDKRSSKDQEGGAPSFTAADLTKQEFRWQYSYSPDIGDASAEAQSAVMRFDVRSRARLVERENSFTMDEYVGTGAIPVGAPPDVPEGVSADASGEIADFVELAYDNRTWHGESHSLTHWQIIGRSTGRLRGAEIVWQSEILTGLFRRQSGLPGFGALALELGFKEGDAEFEDDATPAPDTGNVAGRLVGVLEWAPRIGPVNRSLSSGVRFFVRGRGWLDYVGDGAGDDDLRTVGFFDTEIFWNFAADRRVFVRYESGSLPPDLSQTVSRFSIGIGDAF